MIFVVGRTYSTRSVADHDCLISISVVSRTPKTIKALVRGEEKTLRIKVYDGVYREIDGVSKGTIRLEDMSPSRQAAAPGGSVTWADWAEFKPTSNARYRIAASNESDANPDNNEGEVTVPDRCKNGGSATPGIRPIIRPKLPARVLPRQ